MTRICVAIPVDHAADVPQALQRLARAHAEGATMVEWRVDVLAEDPGALEHIRTLVRESPVPSIVTIRSAEEGGCYGGDDMARVSLIEAIGTGGNAPAYVDFELAHFERSANLRQKVLLAVQHPGQVRTVGARLILSAHDFTGRPPALARQVAAMASEEACAVVKLAWRARSVRDNIEAFELLAERHKPTIALCMGEAGVMSRVLAPKFGAFLTFARAGGPDAEVAAERALREQGGRTAETSAKETTATGYTGTALGQPTVRELVREYGIGRVKADTRVYGVIGWPVAHSRSPRTHNAWFMRYGFDGVYVPLPVPAEYEHFKASLTALLDYAPLHFRGASVTMPHKGHLLRFVREWNARGGGGGTDVGASAGAGIGAGTGIVEPLAARIGAANTLVVREDGTLMASNTDAPAAVEALLEGMGIGGATGGSAAGPAAGSTTSGHAVSPQRSRLRVAVIGAGGVARAVAAGLTDAGVRVVLFSRTPERARTLAEELSAQEGEVLPGVAPARVSAGRMEELACGCFDAFVNCTPVGMEGGPDSTGSPLPDEVHLHDGVTVMDTVYAPRLTPLLREARARGARTVDGWSMFIKQAALQFEQWVGVRPEDEPSLDFPQ